MLLNVFFKQMFNWLIYFMNTNLSELFLDITLTFFVRDYFWINSILKIIFWCEVFMFTVLFVRFVIMRWRLIIFLQGVKWPKKGFFSGVILISPLWLWLLTLKILSLLIGSSATRIGWCLMKYFLRLSGIYGNSRINTCLIRFFL